MNEVAESNREELKKRYRTTALIVLGQIFSTLFLTATAWFLAAQSENSIAPQAISALWVLILVVAVGSFVLRRMLFSWERLKNIALTRGVLGVLGSLQTNSIVLGSLAVVVAIVGFLLAVLSGNKMETFRAGAIALIVFLLNFPRRSIWEKILAGIEKI